MDKRVDKAILTLNQRYQDSIVSNSNSKYQNISRYISNLKRGKIKQIISDLRYRSYALKHFTPNGNLDYETKGFQRNEVGKLAVYSCITGGYDRLIEPVYIEDGVDYYMFTDMKIPDDSAWERIDVNQFPDLKGLSSVQINRRIKMMPFEYLSDYDFTIYVDGNIEIVAGLSPLIEEMGNCSLGVHYHNYRDCIYDEYIAVEHYKKIDKELSHKQLSQYTDEGFPSHYGLYENAILIRKNSDAAVKELMEEWWEEYLRYPTRDQFSLPYVVWKKGFDRSKIHIIGKNLNRNPRFNRNVIHT